MANIRNPRSVACPLCRAVPGEPAASSGWMDNYMQLLLPFYTSNWRGAYLQFVRELVDASIPVALDEAKRQGRIKPGDIVLFNAFGAGFAWGAAVVKF